MLYHWPIAYAIPALIGEKYPSEVETIQRLFVALHRLGLYNLLQVSKAILTNQESVRAVCVGDEFRLLQGYVICLCVHQGMPINITWKSDVGGEPDKMYACTIESSCENGPDFEVDCEGVLYTVSAYLDEITFNNYDALLARFDSLYSDDTLKIVEMPDEGKRNVYCAHFDEMGKIVGDCKVRSVADAR